MTSDTKEHGEAVECPKRDDKLHCNCWYDGEACCSCGDASVETAAYCRGDCLTQIGHADEQRHMPVTRAGFCPKCCLPKRPTPERPSHQGLIEALVYCAEDMDGWIAATKRSLSDPRFGIAIRDHEKFIAESRADLAARERHIVELRNHIAALEVQRPSITQELREAMKIVNEQAEDEGLWFEAEYITESVLQAALRRLHAALEAAAKGETCTRVASYAGEKAG